MRKIAFILITLLVALHMHAEDSIPVSVPVDTAAVSSDTVRVASPAVNLLDSMRGVQVLQDSAMALLLDEAMFGKRELVEIDGYRVQIYSSNLQQAAKVEALNLESKLKDKVTQTIYVLYQSPFWKVRIGDFRSYEEAREYKKLFVQLYPHMMGDTYIVRDKIKVMQ